MAIMACRCAYTSHTSSLNHLPWQGGLLEPNAIQTIGYCFQDRMLEVWHQQRP
jgi:hypothetical protein